MLAILALKVMTVQCAVIAALFAYYGDRWRTLYFMAAFLINVAVLNMR